MRIESIRPEFLAVALGASLLAAGCAGLRPDAAPDPGPSTDPSPSPSMEPPEGPALDAPPPVTLRYLDDRIELEPWAYCYGFGCADGLPPSPPPDVGEPEEVVVEFPPRGGRSPRASLRPGRSADECRACRWRIGEMGRSC